MLARWPGGGGVLVGFVLSCGVWLFVAGFGFYCLVWTFLLFFFLLLMGFLFLAWFELSCWVCFLLLSLSFPAVFFSLLGLLSLYWACLFLLSFFFLSLGLLFLDGIALCSACLFLFGLASFAGLFLTGFDFSYWSWLLSLSLQFLVFACWVWPLSLGLLFLTGFAFSCWTCLVLLSLPSLVVLAFPTGFAFVPFSSSIVHIIYSWALGLDSEETKI